MIRMFYGAADYKQFVDFYHTGIKVNGDYKDYF